MKNFLKTYLTDWKRFTFMAVFSLAITIPFAFLIGSQAWVFFLGFWMFDPISYYFITYRSEQAAQKAFTKRFVEFMKDRGIDY